MPKIREDIIRAVTERARIEDVVGEFVTLRKAGVNMTGICPFHDDKHDGNFIVRPSTVSEKNGGNTYRCFVCGKKGGPVTFLMEAEHMTFPDAIRWLGKKYCVDVDDVPVNWTPPPPRPVPPPLPRLTFKRETVRESLKGMEQNTFVRWFIGLPWSEKQRERLWQTLHMYCVARCPHGDEWVSFWQIDHEGTPLTAKYMRYKPDGHRVKDRDEQGNRVFANDWEHAWRAREKQYDASKWDTSGRALFGAHLLKRYPQAIVNVVESEKTALIMANYYGDPDRQMWLACGGLKHLRLEAMQPLIDQGRTVWLWPDKDGVKEWQQVADKLGSEKVQVYSRFFETCWKQEDGEKADAADITIRMMRTGDKPRDASDPQSTTEKFATASDQGGVNSSATPEPKPEGVTEEEWQDHLRTMDAIKDWQLVHPGDEPFLDPIEFQDPQVRERREKIRMNDWLRRHQGQPVPLIQPTSTIEGVKVLGEIMKEHPIIKKLLKTDT